MNKLCTKCKLSLSIEKFLLRKSGRYDSWCRACNAKSSQQWRIQNREKHRKQSRDWAKNNPEHKRNTRYKYQYGITLYDYNKLLEKQRGACGICFGSQDQFTKKFAVDHDHNTGRVRGLLCTRCNKGIGHFSDSTMLLKNAILYLTYGISVVGSD